MQKNTAMSRPTTGCDNYIDQIKKILPELATTKDLVRIGLYRTEQAAAHNRRAGTGPEYFHLNQRCIMYPKQGIIDYLEKKRVMPKRNQAM